MKKKILALTAPLLLATTLATEASASTESFNVNTTPPVLFENDLTQNNVTYGFFDKFCISFFANNFLVILNIL